MGLNEYYSDTFQPVWCEFQKSYVLDGHKVFLDKNASGENGYALLHLTIRRTVLVRRNFCVNFANFIRYGDYGFKLHAVQFRVSTFNTTSRSYGVIQSYCFTPETFQPDFKVMPVFVVCVKMFAYFEIFTGEFCN